MITTLILAGLMLAMLPILIPMGNAIGRAMVDSCEPRTEHYKRN